MAGDGDDVDDESQRRDAEDGPTQQWAPASADGPRSLREHKLRAALAGRFAKSGDDDEPTSGAAAVRPTSKSAPSSRTPASSTPPQSSRGSQSRPSQTSSPSKSQSSASKSKASSSGRRERKSTLRSAQHKRTGWVLPAAVAALVIAGGAAAWVMLSQRMRPKPAPAAPAAPSATATTAPAVDGNDIDLSLHLTPPEAVAWLDGEPVDPTSRIAARPCPLGHHELRVEAKGFVTETRRIPCHGLVVLDVRLAPAP